MWQLKFDLVQKVVVSLELGARRRNFEARFTEVVQETFSSQPLNSINMSDDYEF